MLRPAILLNLTILTVDILILVPEIHPRVYLANVEFIPDCKRGGHGFTGKIQCVFN